MEQYKVATQNDLIAFEEMITNLINNGWKLVGGVNVVVLEETSTTFRARYYQAVIKHSEFKG